MIYIQMRVDDSNIMLDIIKKYIKNITFVHFKSENHCELTLDAKERDDLMIALLDVDGFVRELKFERESQPTEHREVPESQGSEKVQKTMEVVEADYTKVDQMIATSTDLSQLTKELYKYLDIVPRRGSDSNFEKMIKKLQSLDEVACNLTIKETEFTASNLRTFSKACRKKGLDPYDLIEHICAESYDIAEKSTEKDDVREGKEPYLSMPGV